MRLTDHDLRVQFPGSTKREALSRVKEAQCNGRATQAADRSLKGPAVPKPKKAASADCVTRKTAKRLITVSANSVFNLGES